MAAVNVYVPDDLKDRLDESGLNLSAIARGCWETELELAALETNEVRIEFDEEELRFTGSLLASNGEDELYLTEDDQLVWVSVDRYDVGDRDDVSYEGLRNHFREKEATDEAARALGIKRVVEL